ncbi:unnamed protein product [Dracunculus medinensis]|uniref:TMC domain-containing protein n=1 Tax=Dracunculus medinensis TaxID=318479 RepID=A0A0N4UGV0_DRAME|nr:unnamed protein product [Dracunculus medinensis]
MINLDELTERTFIILTKIGWYNLKKQRKIDCVFCRETEHFLDHGPSDGNKSQDDDEDEERPVSRQVLLDKIREKKEVIGKLRCQPWNMNRKRRTLRLAQKYLAQNEPRVSKTHLYKGELIKTWRRFCRWLSHFGSVVSSYFTFLRWVIFVNLVISLIIISLIVIPEVLADTAADEDRKNRTDSRKVIPPNERFHADELQVVWHYDGYIKYSPLFYGYYSNDEFVGSGIRYALPLAYFLVTLFVFGYSCFAILRKMASNAKLSKMAGSKDNQYTFNWKLFTGWDYTIGNPETAYNTVMAIIIKIRESIAECRTQVRDQFQLLLFLTRFLANAVILAMLAFSIYCISFAVQTSQTVEQTGGLINKNQMPTIVATITHVFPMIFDLIGTVERYHPRTALRAHLTRVLVLYVLNYMTLIVALFEKLDKIRGDEISKLIDERQLSIRSKRLQAQNGTGLSFSSKNFTDNEQAKRFRNGSFERFSLRYSRQSKILRDKLANGVQVKSEFGPVRLNNPDAILLNMSYADEERRFKAIKLGPSPLPTFTRTPFKPKKLPTNVFLVKYCFNILI